MKLRFGDCVLDLSARQLERQGTVVRLEPKVHELLETLIKRRPAVVTHEELDELLWPQVYVARTSLTRLVSELRAALGDTPRDSRIIRTVYKAGYAFCAEVGAEPSAAPAAIELLWKNQLFPLVDGEHLAGREEAYAVRIDASTVSRRHARIVVVCGNATIEDLESTNGTSVNGKRIACPTSLSPGDELALGSEKLQIRQRDPQAKTELCDA
jgi:DNA-binding winged helix-turn-helix (wHTH) protein